MSIKISKKASFIQFNQLLSGAVMSIKKISIYLVLFSILTSSGYLYYRHNHNSIDIEKDASEVEIKKSSIDVSKLPEAVSENLPSLVNVDAESNKKDLELSKNNSYFVVAFLFLLCLNVVTVLALLGVLSWRKTVANGMMAILPNEIMKTFEVLSKNQNVVSQNQNKITQWLQSSFAEISKALSDQVQSIEILKKELEFKDTELAYFRSGALSIEKDKTISKLVKLHSFLKTLELQIMAGGVKHEVAISFLKDELADLFVEFNITEINPSLLTSLNDMPLESYAVKEVLQVNDLKLNQTVAELLESGYYLNFPDGKGKVIRAASIKINKFGE